MSDLKVLIKKLQYIHAVCGDAVAAEKTLEKIPEKTGKFSDQKKRVAQLSRALKILIADPVSAEATRADEARRNFLLRQDLKNLEKEVQLLAKIQDGVQKKYESKKLSEEAAEKLQRQAEVVELAHQNLEKLRNASRQRTAARFDGFSDPLDGGDELQVLIGEIPDLDGDQDFQQLRRKDQEIDAGLDEILSSLKLVKEIALTMQEELQLSDAQLEHLETHTQEVFFQLKSQNGRLAGLLRKTKSPGNVCCTVFFVHLLLGSCSRRCLSFYGTLGSSFGSTPASLGWGFLL